MELSNLNIEELGQLFPIEISTYDYNWPKLYKVEKSTINRLFNNKEIIKIDHIGSTAIPRIKAKPTIDILLQVNNQTNNSKIINNLKSLGYYYIFRPENPPPHMMFVKGYTTKGFSGQVYHIHVRYPGDWDELYFRDY